uniref:Protein enabled homolog n=1 Tax=Monodon monoceros TaxID=40151 RepID=A0A8C6B4M7_MONMO
IFSQKTLQTRREWHDTFKIISEQSICQARTALMFYDDANKKWVPAGGSTRFSRVHIYQHTGNNTFRGVGRKIQDHQVVINCAIPKGLKYNQATQTFHQWRDARQVYGLNFGSKEDANVFTSAMMHALEVLNSQETGPTLPRQNSQLTAQVQNGPSQEELEIQRRQQKEHQQQKELERERATGPRPVLLSCVSYPVPQMPPSPAAPIPPSPSSPPAATLPASGFFLGSMSVDNHPSTGIAAAIAGAKLRKVSWLEDASFPSGGNTTGVNSASSKTDRGRGNGPLPLAGSGLMEGMSTLLAGRRRIAPVTSKASSTSTPEPTRKPWERTNTMNGSKPKSVPLSQPSVNGVQTEGLDYDRLKQDILDEMRKELTKLKEELIDAIRQELSKSNTA